MLFIRPWQSLSLCQGFLFSGGKQNATDQTMAALQLTQAIEQHHKDNIGGNHNETQ